MKNTISRLLALAICLSMSASVTGCSSSESSSQNSSEAAVSATSKVPKTTSSAAAEQAPVQIEKPSQENTVTVESQTLGLSGVSNARQLGGYHTEDGRQVKDSVLLRSGKLSDATEEDIQKLREVYNVTTIVDFRTTDEVASAPDPEIAGAQNVSVKILDESSDSGQASMVGIYSQSDNPAQSILEMYRAGVLSEDMYTSLFDSEFSLGGYREFFDLLLSQEEGALLWHCTGGKDRAGTAAVLLLTILGVDEQTVLADFALTNAFNERSIGYMTEQAKLLTDDQTELDGVAALVGVSPNLMENVFELGQRESGSLFEFIKEKLSLTDEEIESLRDKYLV